MADRGRRPAFPATPSQFGMTYREWLAGQIMGNYRSLMHPEVIGPETAAGYAVADADALIAELAKEKA